jgi:hypothetical protein
MITIDNINAIVKKIAPPKQGVKNGIVPASAQPSEQLFLFHQLINSIIKFVQANKNPINKTINCALISDFIYFYFLFSSINFLTRAISGAIFENSSCAFFDCSEFE